MLAAHNELRGQYCGAGAPLTWDCGLAKEAQKFAEDCACGHSNAPGVGENLATRSVLPDKYPAGSDRDAFNDTWGCEQTEFHFDNPVIVGGFKEDCHKGKDGNPPVNGHFTQVVWKSNKQLGCGRARCP
ncbi:MAG: CAP domain-containing protein [Hyphomicrobium sp.]